MAVPTISLNNGYEMPIVGLGTFLAQPGEVEQAVKDAIDAGYRHIDCAYFYGNEAEVGVAIKEKIADRTVRRHSLFIVSKLWNTFHSRKLVSEMCKKSCENLGLDYLDLFLIHTPCGWQEGGDLTPQIDDEIQESDVDYLETWKGMEDCVEQGLARSIGLSNFNSEQIDRLLAHAKIKPVVNQVECNVNINQKELIAFCKSRDIVMTAYTPLGRPGNTRLAADVATFNDPKIVQIGKKYGKTGAQVVLRYLIQKQIYPIPKSVTKSRIIENIDVLFALSKDEMDYIDSLHTGIRVCSFDNMKKHKYFPFNIKF